MSMDREYIILWVIKKSKLTKEELRELDNETLLDIYFEVEGDI